MDLLVTVTVRRTEVKLVFSHSFIFSVTKVSSFSQLSLSIYVMLIHKKIRKKKHIFLHTYDVTDALSNVLHAIRKYSRQHRTILIALNANVHLSGNWIFRKKQQMTEATNEPLKTFF